jgi:hypothetical protein
LIFSKKKRPNPHKLMDWIVMRKLYILKYHKANRIW